MKKLFKFAFVALSVVAIAACNKDKGLENDGKDDGQENVTPTTVDADLVGTWTITGEAQGWAADGGVTMTEKDNVWTAAEVTVKGEGFKFVKDGSRDINLGAVTKDAKADGVEFDLTKNGENIAGTQGDGVYSVTLNLLTKKAAITFVKGIEEGGEEGGEEFQAVNFNDKAISVWTNLSKNIDLSKGLTYVLHFNISALQDNTYICVFAAQGGGHRNRVRLGEVPGHTPQLEWCFNEQYRVETTTAFEADKWYSVALVAEEDGNRLIYVDGVQEDTLRTVSNTALEYTDGKLPAANLIPMSDEIFGAIEWGDSWGTSGYLDSVRPFPGQICMISVWSKALSAEEVKALVKTAPANLNDENLVAFWPMQEGEGHVFYDKSANKYDIDFSDNWLEREDDKTSADAAATMEAQWTPTQW